MRWIVALALAAGGPAALAQGKPALRVLLEGVSPDAAACGIKAQAVEAVAAKALAARGIQVSSDARDPFLYINVNAYRVMQDARVVGCTMRLGVSVRGPAAADARVGSFRSKSGAHVVLCEAGRLMSGAQRDVAGAVAKAFDEDIKKCLGDVEY